MAGNKPPNTPTCQTCKHRYDTHTGVKCRACNTPIEHHTTEQQHECWAGRARMAWAKQQAGVHLNDVDREALQRCPTPEILGLGGYRHVEEPDAL